MTDASFSSVGIAFTPACTHTASGLSEGCASGTATGCSGAHGVRPTVVAARLANGAAVLANKVGRDALPQPVGDQILRQPQPRGAASPPTARQQQPHRAEPSRLRSAARALYGDSCRRPAYSRLPISRRSSASCASAERGQQQAIRALGPALPVARGCSSQRAHLGWPCRRRAGESSARVLQRRLGPLLRAHAAAVPTPAGCRVSPRARTRCGRRGRLPAGAHLLQQLHEA